MRAHIVRGVVLTMQVHSPIPGYYIGTALLYGEKKRRCRPWFRSWLVVCVCAICTGPFLAKVYTRTRCRTWPSQVQNWESRAAGVLIAILLGEGQEAGGGSVWREARVCKQRRDSMRCAPFSGRARSYLVQSVCSLRYEMVKVTLYITVCTSSTVTPYMWGFRSVVKFSLAIDSLCFCRSHARKVFTNTGILPTTNLLLPTAELG
jgi:hypothetical protein